MAADIWSVADMLRGHYMRHEYGEVILPLTVLRRLDAVMAKTRQAVRDRDAALTRQDIKNKDRPLQLAAKLPFYNTSKQDFSTITADNSLPSVAKEPAGLPGRVLGEHTEDRRAVRSVQPDQPDV